MVNSITLSSFLCVCWKLSDHRGSGAEITVVLWGQAGDAPLPQQFLKGTMPDWPPGLPPGWPARNQLGDLEYSLEMLVITATVQFPIEEYSNSAEIPPWFASCPFHGTKKDQSPNWVRVMTEFLLPPRLTKQTHQNKIKPHLQLLFP